MNALFIGVLAVYTCHAIFANARRAKDAPADKPAGTPFEERPVKTPVSMILQTVLFVVACAAARGDGVFGRGLFSPPHIIAGLIGGHLIFGLSVAALHRGFREAAEIVWDLGSLGEFLKECPNLIFRYVILSISEELIFRAAAQPILIAWTGVPVLGVAGAAAIFAVTHRHFMRNGRHEAFEFAAFSLVLGALYFWSGSLILVIIIHTVRNVEIAYLEFLMDLGEADGEEAAWKAFEKRHANFG